MHSSKISQMVSLRQLGGPPEVQIRNLLNDISSPPESLLQIQNNFTKMFLMMTSTQNCTIGFAPLNKGVTRALDKKCL